MDLDQQLRDTTFVAFDTETTGLMPVSSGLLEIGALKFRLDGTDVGTFSQLIDPEGPIPEEAVSIHGITDEMVRGMPKVQEVMPRFIDFLGPPENLLLAHNALFDLGFIVLDLIRARMPLPEHKVFDTVLLARALIPFLPGYRLQGLCAALGVSRGQEHRALSDARMVKGLFLSLLAQAGGAETVAGLAAISAPVEFANAPVSRVDAPPGFEGLAAALDTGAPVEIAYATDARTIETSRITPVAIVEYEGKLYLAAYCHLEGRNRMFRLNRIKGLNLDA